MAIVRRRGEIIVENHANYPTVKEHWIVACVWPYTQKVCLPVTSDQTRIEEVAEMSQFLRLKFWWPFFTHHRSYFYHSVIFFPKIPMTFFIVTFSWPFFSITSSIFAFFLLSRAALKLTSAYIHASERRSRNTRGGRTPLRCAPPYFDHCAWHRQFASIEICHILMLRLSNTAYHQTQCHM